MKGTKLLQEQLAKVNNWFAHFKILVYVHENLRSSNSSQRFGAFSNKNEINCSIDKKATGI